MPKNKYPGTKSDESFRYFETKVSFSTLSTNTKILNIEKPPQQGPLYEQKISSMMEEYKTSPFYLKFKNKITIGVLNGIYYVIDGQHRLEMCKRLYENNNIEDVLFFCWFECNNEKDIHDLFISVNKDSSKNEIYLNQPNHDQIKYNELIRLLSKNKYLFGKNSTKDTRKRKTIEEFRNELIEINFMNTYKTGVDAYTGLMNLNYKFCEINSYSTNLEYNIGIFYDCDKECLSNKFIFPLKNSNFIDWIKNPDSVAPKHKYKSAKKRITRKLKLDSWVKEFGNNDKGKCPIKNCSELLCKNNINDWHAGHIISEKNWGETTIHNLRPICCDCNRAMGSMNWDEYDS
tara:strand:- start:5766 stop:6803 length:1038 start_codon:yes stop_codon:yes gene_type:complete